MLSKCKETFFCCLPKKPKQQETPQPKSISSSPSKEKKYKLTGKTREIKTKELKIKLIDTGSPLPEIAESREEKAPQEAELIRTSVQFTPVYYKKTTPSSTPSTFSDHSDKYYEMKESHTPIPKNDESETAPHPSK